MPADPRDDFSPFDDSTHMFFGLTDPFAYIRRRIESVLAQQVPGTRVHSIRCHGEPNFLTIGRKLEEDPENVVVTYWATCFRCEIAVESPDQKAELPSTITLCAGQIDEPGQERTQLFLDLFDDADKAFEEAFFKERFVEFRYGPAH
jgi:hypothetical protein